jgi:hypothetical protein
MINKKIGLHMKQVTYCLFFEVLNEMMDSWHGKGHSADGGISCYSKFCFFNPPMMWGI